MRKSITIPTQTIEKRVFVINFLIEQKINIVKISAYNLSEAIFSIQMRTKEANLKTYHSHVEISFNNFKSLIKY